MLASFLVVVFATLASLVGADWIRNRDDSIVAGFGGLVTASRKGVSKGVARLAGLATTGGVMLVGIAGLFVLSRLIG